MRRKLPLSRSKRSVIWTIPRNELQELVSRSNSISDIMRKLGYKSVGGTFKVMKDRLLREGFDVSHITFGRNSNKGKKFNFSRTKEEAIEDLFVLSSSCDPSTIRRYVSKYELLGNNCKECGVGREWNNMKLTLQIDHIDGDRNNNQLVNLRLLCPNCHSQTKNFGVLNKKRIAEELHPKLTMVLPGFKAGAARLSA